LQHGEDLVGVGRPIGCDVQISACGDPQRELVDEWRLQQTSLVMPLFRPRIGKVDVNAGQRPARYPSDDVDGIGAHEPNVVEPVVVEPAQQCTDAWQMHLDADKIDMRVRSGDCGRCFAHAETDLEHDGRGPAKDCRPIERTIDRNAITGQQCFTSPLLSG
jgi:hypothetical protein